MFQQEVTVTSPNGMQMRVVTQFVTAAKAFNSNITVTTPDGRSASARRPLDLLGLGAKQGQVLTVSANGSDEQASVEHLVKLLTQLFAVAVG
jgi:phosphotransferase system HPr (HPr) family protein